MLLPLAPPPLPWYSVCMRNLYHEWLCGDCKNLRSEATHALATGYYLFPDREEWSLTYSKHYLKTAYEDRQNMCSLSIALLEELIA